MDEWEYLPTFVEANAKDKETKNFLKDRIPGLKRPPRYMPEAMMVKLNEYGADGWELVHMEPVRRVGRKQDVLFESFGRRWSNVYFCVFKRRKPQVSLSAAAQIAEPPAYEPLPREAEEAMPVLPVESLNETD